MAAETVQINLKINGAEAFSTLKDLNAHVAASKNVLNKLDKADPGYAEAAKNLRTAIDAQKAWRTEIYGSKEAAKGLFAEIKAGVGNIAAGVSIGNLIASGIQSAASAISSFIGTSQAAFEEAELNQAQLAAVIKSTGSAAGKSQEDLNKLAGSLMELTGVDDDLITKSEALLLTFTNIGGEIYDQTLPLILDMSKAMGTDLQSASIQVGKALNDPIKGITALSRVGVSFSENQKEVIKQMTETGNIAGAQKLILAELSKEFGGVAEAMAETASGKGQKFATWMGNQQEKIGEMIISIKGGLIDAFFGFGRILQDTGGFLANNTAALTGMAYVLVLLTGNFLKATINSAANTTAVLLNKAAYELGYARMVLMEVATKAYAFAKGVLTGQITLATAAQRIWNAVLLANPIGAIITGLFALVAAVQLYSKNNAEAIKLERDKAKLNKDLESLNKSLAASQEGINAQIANFNLLSSDERANLLKTIELKKQEALARLQNLKARQMELAKDAAAPTFAQKVANNVMGAFNPMGAGGTAAMNAQASANNMAASFAETQPGIKALEDQIKGFDTSISKVSAKVNAFSNAMKIGGVTSDQLREKQTLLKDALGGAVIGSAEYKKISAELDEVNKKLGGGKKSGSGKTALEKDVEDHKKFLAEITQAEEENYANRLTANQREILENDKKYEALMNRAKSGSAEEKRIQAEWQESSDIIREKQQKEEEKALEEVTKKTQEELNKRLQDRENISQKIFELGMNDSQKEQAGIDTLFESMVAEADAAGLDTDAIFTAWSAAKLKGYESDAEMAKKSEQEKADFAIEMASLASDTIFSIAAQRRQAETQANIDAINKRREAELSNQELTDAQRKSINDKYDKEVVAQKKKAFIADQRAAVAQAVINGALSVLKVTSQVGVLAPFVIPGIIAATLAQIAVIVAQKAPQFAKGGLIPAGPSHQNGGIALINPDGRKIGEMEGGEPILSRETYANNRELIDTLLYSSQRQNGARIGVNTSRAVQAEQMFRTGGISPISQGSASHSPATQVNVNMDDLINEIKALRKDVQEEKLRPAKLVYTDIEKAKERMDGIRNSVNS